MKLPGAPLVLAAVRVGGNPRPTTGGVNRTAVLPTGRETEGDQQGGSAGSKRTGRKCLQGKHGKGSHLRLYFFA